MADSRRYRRRSRKQEARAEKRRRRREVSRRRSSGGGVLRLFAMLLVVVALLACAVIFFKVTDIRVTGCQLYTPEQVAGASGIAPGDNLLLVRKSTAAARLKVMLPYIENVRIGRELPGTVTIEVSESGAAFLVEARDRTSWLINSSGKVLEEAEVSVADYPKLTGVTVREPEPGLQVLTEDTANLAAGVEMMKLLEGTDLISRIAEIDVRETYDIILWYGVEYEIHLGGTDRLDYKLRYLLSILDQLDSARGGVIDLTLEDKDVAVFREFDDGAEKEE